MSCLPTLTPPPFPSASSEILLEGSTQLRAALAGGTDGSSIAALPGAVALATLLHETSAQAAALRHGSASAGGLGEVVEGEDDDSDSGSDSSSSSDSSASSTSDSRAPPSRSAKRRRSLIRGRRRALRRHAGKRHPVGQLPGGPSARAAWSRVLAMLSFREAWRLGRLCRAMRSVLHQSLIGAEGTAVGALARTPALRQLVDGTPGHANK